jgi:hypothetical protein
MPMWKFFAGDFRSPLELSGLAPVVHYATPDGGIFTRFDLRGRISRWRARRRVRELAGEVAMWTGRPIQWRDEGPTVYTAQFRTAHALRAYIWWYERRDLLPQFEQAEEASPEAGRLWRVAPERPTRFPHLALNSYYNDYFLPVDFDRVVDLGGGRASSTPRALRELDLLNQDLRVPEVYEWQEEDPLALVKATFSQVREFLRLSDRHGLPVIFWG